MEIEAIEGVAARDGLEKKWPAERCGLEIGEVYGE